MRKASSNKALICCLLIVITAAAYWRVYQFSFIPSYDDGPYVTQNSHVQAGLTWSNLVWALKATVDANWHPVTLLSHMADCQLFGLAPAGPHLTNLALHILNVVLLFWVLQLSTAMVWRSAFVASLFALHPLNVESVAWVAERKNVLSTMFFLLAIWAYIWYAYAPNWKRYLTVAALFALGLMSKPMLVTFPFVLLLLDFWPLSRWKHRPPASTTDAVAGGAGLGGNLAERFASRPTRDLVLEKVPLILLSVVSSLLTLRAQSADSAVAPWAVIPAGSRISNALVSYMTYLQKTVWPTGLAAFYPHPLETLPSWEVGLAAAGMIGMTWLAFRAAGRFKFFTFGWFWYLGTLIPVIGLLQVGAQARADRYAYIPLIGVFIILVWGGVEAAAHWRLPRALPVIVAVSGVIALALTAARQINYWHDSITLFEHAEQVTTGNSLAYGVLYRDYTAAGKPDQALLEFSKEVDLDSQNAMIQQAYARALQRAGRLQEAITHLRAAVELDPNSYDRYNELGIALAEAGNLDEARSCFDKVIQLKPDDAHAYANLGSLSEQIGDTTQAVAYYTKSADALANNPVHSGDAGRAMLVQINLRLGGLLAKIGDPKGAKVRYAEALRLQPNSADARQGLDVISKKLGNAQN
jgi:tetratricopeptide (TPR) repeat protein